MIPVLAVSLAVAVIACVWLGARGARSASDLRESRGRVETLEAEVATGADARVALDAKATQAAAQADTATDRADAADEARSAAEQDLSTAREAAAAAEALAADAEARAEAADTRAEETQAEMAQMAAAQADTDEGAAEWSSGPGPEVLWGLELARTERTWRTSVAADPTADAPEASADPLRSAVDIDLVALREESGVDFELVWLLSDSLRPVASLAVLRSVQELVAAATPMADEGRVVVSVDGADVNVVMTEPDGEIGRFATVSETLAGRGLEVTPGGVRITGAAPAPVA